MPTVQRLHHVNVAVADLEAAAAFYGDLLGLAVTDRPDFGIGGLWYDLGQGQLHLVELEGATAGPYNHFALQVDDLDAWVARLEAAGVTVDRATHTPGAGHQAFVRDPTGNQVELNEPER